MLQALGAVGGAGLTLGALEALGLLSPKSVSPPFRPPARTDFGLTGRANASVLILGAGIAGLTSAYELEKAGYHCTILEARDRPGGRNWTVRHLTSETSLDGVTQTCQFDDGLHMNVGPTRIAQHHITLDYCRELGIPIHLFNNANIDAYYYLEDAGRLSGQRLRHRAVQADSRGYIAELLAKAINQGALDQDLTPGDANALLEWLSTTGALTPQNRYVSTSARGYHSGAYPGAGLQSGTLDPPFALSDLLALTTTGSFNLALFLSMFEYDWDQAMPMFEPDGGMDRIPQALAQTITGPIHYGAQVTSIENMPSGVQIGFRDRAGADQAEQQASADYCICTLPPHLLTRIPNNFPAQTKADLQVPVPFNAGKIGLQFRRRFWEEDDRIFGGITYTNLDILQILYPSQGYLEQKGVVIGYYTFDGAADALGALTPQQREQRALAQGRKIHGAAYQTEFEASFSNDWRKTRFSEGSWITWPEGARGGPDSPYGRLLQPAGRIYFAGDYLSYAIAWQHGAFESARKVVTDLHARVLSTPPSAALIAPDGSD
jgi:monoamine oxidase